MCECKDKSSCKHAEIKLRGPRGYTGPQGLQGTVGPQGVQGVQGLNGPTGPTGMTGPSGSAGSAGAPGATGAQGVAGIPTTIQDTTTIDLDYTGGILTAVVQDTGWVDLLGFTYYGAQTVKPQCRRIGNQIHFRGSVVVPLANPATPTVVVPFTSTSAYNGISGCKTFSGTGGCALNSNGSIVFNNDTSVIPLSVLNAPTLLDGSYTKTNHVGTRPIDIDATDGTSLSANFTVVITSAKKLVIGTLKDQELTASSASSNNIGTSSLRFITSTIVAGQNVPNYINSSTIHNAPGGAVYNLSTDGNTGVWPFTCDAGTETDIGGFFISLDGLTAFISPCATTIPTPTPVC